MNHADPASSSTASHPHLPTVIEIISTLGRELQEAKERIQQFELALSSCSCSCRDSQVPGLQLQLSRSNLKPGSQLLATGTDPASSQLSSTVPVPTTSQPTPTVPTSPQPTPTLPPPTTSQLENLESQIHQLQEERETLLEEGWKLKLKVTNLQTEIDTIRGIKREELAAQALSSSLHRQNEENVKRKTSDEHDRVLDLEATIASLKSDLDERDFKISELKQANSLLERRGKAWSLQDYLPILTHLPNVPGRPGPRGMPLCSVMERGVLEGVLKGVLEGMLAQPENDRTNGLNVSVSANANATPYLYLPRALLCLPGEAQHNLALAPKYRFDVEGGVWIGRSGFEGYYNYGGGCSIGDECCSVGHGRCSCSIGEPGSGAHEGSTRTRNEEGGGHGLRGHGGDHEITPSAGRSRTGVHLFYDDTQTIFYGGQYKCVDVRNENPHGCWNRFIPEVRVPIFDTFAKVWCTLWHSVVHSVVLSDNIKRQR
ncbi:hypothetical protein CC2G_009873 [Coprinopsis cinerea AmutBmut pab1-1]|nr:hypothetical protein CC2G_009873 [Coprinopsis cinerea AmutBmut pab1-1]